MHTHCGFCGDDAWFFTIGELILCFHFALPRTWDNACRRIHHCHIQLLIIYYRKWFCNFSNSMWRAHAHTHIIVVDSIMATGYHPPPLLSQKPKENSCTPQISRMRNEIICVFCHRFRGCWANTYISLYEMKIKGCRGIQHDKYIRMPSSWIPNHLKIARTHTKKEYSSEIINFNSFKFMGSNLLSLRY